MAQNKNLGWMLQQTIWNSKPRLFQSGREIILYLENDNKHQKNSKTNECSLHLEQSTMLQPQRGALLQNEKGLQYTLTRKFHQLILKVIIY